MDLHLSQKRIEPEITDGDENDKCKGVEVGQDIVWQTIQLHDGSLRRKIVVQLVICKPVKREPAEDGASSEATAYFIDPSIVEGHP